MYEGGGNFSENLKWNLKFLYLFQISEALDQDLLNVIKN